MKKQLTALFLAFALLLTLSGCATANSVQKMDAAEDKVEAKLDALEDKLEDSIERAIVPAPAPKEDQAPAAAPKEIQKPAPAPVPQETQPAVPAAPENAKLLTKEEAQQIALDYVGLTSDQVSRLHTEYEIDDRIPQYDVQFRQGNLEYEFEIHAESGQILSFDKDYD